MISLQKDFYARLVICAQKDSDANQEFKVSKESHDAVRKYLDREKLYPVERKVLLHQMLEKREKEFDIEVKIAEANAAKAVQDIKDAKAKAALDLKIAEEKKALDLKNAQEKKALEKYNKKHHIKAPTVPVAAVEVHTQETKSAPLLKNTFLKIERMEDKINSEVNNPVLKELHAQLEFSEELLRSIKEKDRHNPKIPSIEESIFRLRRQLRERSYF